jgi:hypothetical protein
MAQQYNPFLILWWDPFLILRGNALFWNANVPYSGGQQCPFLILCWDAFLILRGCNKSNGNKQQQQKQLFNKKTLAAAGSHHPAFGPSAQSRSIHGPGEAQDAQDREVYVY